MTIRFFLPAFLMAFIGLAIPAHAQSQAQMNQDANAEFQQADKELNAAYKKLIATLDEESVALLKTAQKAWLAFRDADAKFQADAEARGGTMYPMVYSMRLTADTQQRTKQFQDLLTLQSER